MSARAASTMKLSDQEVEQYIREKLDRLPPRIAQSVHKLRNAQPAWLRLVVAALLMIGGLLWFLPLVGIWMLPLVRSADDWRIIVVPTAGGDLDVAARAHSRGRSVS